MQTAGKTWQIVIWTGCGRLLANANLTLSTGVFWMRLLLSTTAFFIFSSLAFAQSNCPSPQAPSIDPAKLLFSPQQEQELGEIVRQQMESRFHVIEEEQVTG